EQRQDRRLAPGDLRGEHDHPGARAEDRRAAIGQVEDRLVEPPPIDQLAHRRALAAGQDQTAHALEIGWLTDADALDADRLERVEVLAEGALKRQNADLDHGGACRRLRTPPLPA